MTLYSQSWSKSMSFFFSNSSKIHFENETWLGPTAYQTPVLKQSDKWNAQRSFITILIILKPITGYQWFQLEIPRQIGLRKGVVVKRPRVYNSEETARFVRRRLAFQKSGIFLAFCSCAIKDFFFSSLQQTSPVHSLLLGCTPQLWRHIMQQTVFNQSRIKEKLRAETRCNS